MMLPEYQRQGIGGCLAEAAIKFVEAQLKDGWKINIVLVSSAGKEDFYKKFGFIERPCGNYGAGMHYWVTK